MNESRGTSNPPPLPPHLSLSFPHYPSLASHFTSCSVPLFSILSLSYLLYPAFLLSSSPSCSSIPPHPCIIHLPTSLTPSTYTSFYSSSSFLIPLPISPSPQLHPISASLGFSLTPSAQTHTLHLLSSPIGKRERSKKGRDRKREKRVIIEVRRGK